MSNEAKVRHCQDDKNLPQPHPLLSIPRVSAPLLSRDVGVHRRSLGASITAPPQGWVSYRRRSLKLFFLIPNTLNFHFPFSAFPPRLLMPIDSSFLWLHFAHLVVSASAAVLSNILKSRPGLGTRQRLPPLFNSDEYSPSAYSPQWLHK